MNAAKAKSGSIKFRGTHLLVLLAGLFCGGGYGWQLYSLFRDAQMNLPQVLTPGWLRSWKGKALEEDVIGLLPTVPQPDQLAALMMQEQPARIFNQPTKK